MVSLLIGLTIQDILQCYRFVGNEAPSINTMVIVDVTSKAVDKQVKYFC